MKVRCPRCGNFSQYDADNPWRPFCSERCKLIDLGEWVTEKNQIATEETPDAFQPVDDDVIKH